VPEGDTLARTAHVLGKVLVGRTVAAARGRPGGARLERVVGQRVERVEARGKHLLIGFSGGLTLHSHLGLHGSWHRYRPAERWRRAPSRAVAVLDVGQAVAVCFDAPTVELIETRAVGLHPGLAGLGPDVARDDFEPGAALDSLRAGDAGRTLGDALLDQRSLAGLGNVYRSELPFIERLSPFTPLAAVPDDVLLHMLERAARLVAASTASGRRITTGSARAPLYVYGRTGRACRRCGTAIASTTTRGERRRRVYWCPRCQPMASHM